MPLGIGPRAARLGPRGGGRRLVRRHLPPCRMAQPAPAVGQGSPLAHLPATQTTNSTWSRSITAEALNSQTQGQSWKKIHGGVVEHMTLRIWAQSVGVLVGWCGGSWGQMVPRRGPPPHCRPALSSQHPPRPRPPARARRPPAAEGPLRCEICPPRPPHGAVSQESVATPLSSLPRPMPTARCCQEPPRPSAVRGQWGCGRAGLVSCWGSRQSGAKDGQSANDWAGTPHACSRAWWLAGRRVVADG